MSSQEYEMFVFDGKVPRPTPRMKDIDTKMPPSSVLERGANAVRSYWNQKNLRRRKK